ncbi:unnamed protein product [Protopolystoma xenopodis]|uniref:Uncharacterized protein n=1 Tax=Protopolystoma xenopodis TaxID=117903 RepID=A0A448XK27_9PLAT|nr:unnamed protein product [Protopolystoma xenopodis]
MPSSNSLLDFVRISSGIQPTDVQQPRSVLATRSQCLSGGGKHQHMNVHSFWSVCAYACVRVVMLPQFVCKTISLIASFSRKTRRSHQPVDRPVGLFFCGTSSACLSPNASASGFVRRAKSAEELSPGNPVAGITGAV